MRTGRPKGSRNRSPFNRATLAVIGQRFGELVAVKPLAQVKDSHRMWLFACDCGATIERRLSRVREEIKGGRRPACLDCGDGYIACLNCNKRGHTMRTCPEPFDPTKTCPECSDLPWRRPEDGSLCFCRLTFRAEATPARPSERIGGQPWL